MQATSSISIATLQTAPETHTAAAPTLGAAVVEGVPLVDASFPKLSAIRRSDLLELAGVLRQSSIQSLSEKAKGPPVVRYSWDSPGMALSGFLAVFATEAAVAGAVALSSATNLLHVGDGIITAICLLGAVSLIVVPPVADGIGAAARNFFARLGRSLALLDEPYRFLCVNDRKALKIHETLHARAAKISKERGFSERAKEELYRSLVEDEALALEKMAREELAAPTPKRSPPNPND